MIPVITLLVILFVLLLVHRVTSTLLELTGLGRDASRLQALSALTGTGFTTKESELIIGHPVRRRVVMFLMLVGNTGIVTVMGSVVVGYLELRGNPNLPYVALTAVGGALALLVAAYSSWFNHSLERLVVQLSRRLAHSKVIDYAELMQVGRGFSVSTRSVKVGDWVSGKTLAEARLRAEGVMVLGVFRENGEFEGTPDGSTVFKAGDRVVFYGREPDIQRAATRTAGWRGDHDHVAAVEAHQSSSGMGDAPMPSS